MFIWDFVANTVLGQILDWFYGQIVGFLGNFFAEMGSMGAELFDMSWVQSIVLFFSYLGWALYAVGLVVACFECGVEYSSGRGNVRETILNAFKGFLAVELFTQLPVRLYVLAISLQSSLTAGITGFGTVTIGDVAKQILENFSLVDSIANLVNLWRFHEHAHQRSYAAVLPDPYGLCYYQGVFCQPQARRHLTYPDRRGEPVYVQRTERVHRWFHPVVQTGHWLVPDRLFAGHHSGGGPDGIQRSRSAGFGPDALRR